MQKKKRTFKEKQRNRAILRALVQMAFFLLMPSAYSAAFSGVKGIFTQLRRQELLTLTPFVAVLIALVSFTILFGRFFCGYACAFGSLGDWVYGIAEAFRGRIRKRLKRKAGRPAKWQRRLDAALACVKYVILVGIAVLVYLGLYDRLRGTSPWDVFSMLRARRMPQAEYRIGEILLGVIVIGMAVKERFFCRYLCPMGAIFSLLPVFPVFSLHRDRENCLPRCSRCTDVCPASVELTDRAVSYDNSGECFQCGRCEVGCPKGNVSCKCARVHTGKWYFVLLRAVLLGTLLIRIGI